MKRIFFEIILLLSLLLCAVYSQEHRHSHGNNRPEYKFGYDENQLNHGHNSQADHHSSNHYNNEQEFHHSNQEAHYKPNHHNNEQEFHHSNPEGHHKPNHHNNEQGFHHSNQEGGHNHNVVNQSYQSDKNDLTYRENNRNQGNENIPNNNGNFNENYDNHNNKNHNKKKHHKNNWKPNPQHHLPRAPRGYSGWKPSHWGKGGYAYNHNGEKDRRRSHKRYEKFTKEIFGDEAYNENDILTPDELNGREIARPTKYPHVAAIGIQQSDGTMDWKCGGSLIDRHYVITAAHCTTFGGDTATHVRLGDVFLKKVEEEGHSQQIEIENITNFYNYTSETYYNDISLLKLSQPVRFSRFVRPIRLWTYDEIPFDVVFAMGYGATQFGRAPTNVLTYFNLTLIGNEECDKTLPHLEEANDGVIDSQICALDKLLNRDTCQGDSGGPLQLNLPGKMRPRYFLVGITSYGLICGNRMPGVYTRVAHYIDWIEDVVWREESEN